MSDESLINKPLGVILTEANIISVYQLKIALEEQDQDQDLRIGEILSLHGWLKQETADFFAEKLIYLTQQDKGYPLGYYLQEAELLTPQKIEAILESQKISGFDSGLKFGLIAVYRGLLKKETINFFLKHFKPEALELNSYTKTTKFNGKRTKNTFTQMNKKETMSKIDKSTEEKYEEVKWFN